MEKEELETIKQKMRDYRDIFGGELNRIDLLNDAKSIIDLESILNMHYDYIDDMASDAQSHLKKFKRDIGIF